MAPKEGESRKEGGSTEEGDEEGLGCLGPGVFLFMMESNEKKRQQRGGLPKQKEEEEIIAPDHSQHRRSEEEEAAQDRLDAGMPLKVRARVEKNAASDRENQKAKPSGERGDSQREVHPELRNPLGRVEDFLLIRDLGQEAGSCE